MKIKDAKIKEPNTNLKRSPLSASGRVSSINEYTRSEISYIDADRLIPFHNQARSYFDDKEISDLSHTIKQHGIRQPLTIIASPSKEGYFEIVSGERRFRASKLLGIKKIPCIIIQNMQEAQLLSVIENYQRADLHPIELGRSFNNLISSKICSTQEEVAEKIGVARTKVTEVLSFVKNIKREHADWIINNKVSDRKTLRLISNSPPDSLEQLQELVSLDPVKKERTKRRNLSLLSISLREGELVTNKKGIDICPNEMRRILKKVLEEIVADLR